MVGRASLIEALEGAGDERALRLVSMMLDPAYKYFTFARLCQKVGLRLQDIVRVFLNWKSSVALLRLAMHLPDLADDLVIDARSKVKVCVACNGSGRIIEETGPEQLCSACYGEGTIRVIGNPVARRLTFEALGLTGHRRPLVVIQQNYGAAPPSLEDTLIATGKLVDVP
jgi:hypothetical protein